MQHNIIFSTQLKKEGDKLIHIKNADKALYSEFVGHLEEGQTVEVFFDANKDTGTLPQLAKCHAMFKVVANETGDNFDDVKTNMKNKAGLCVKKYIDGDYYLICKSLGNASKEELSAVIQALEETCDFLNIKY